MSLSTLFWRPVNLFRSQEVRAASQHTSDWGLRRLSRSAAGEIKDKAMNTLEARYLNKKYSIYDANMRTLAVLSHSANAEIRGLVTNMLSVKLRGLNTRSLSGFDRETVISALVKAKEEIGPYIHMKAVGLFISSASPDELRRLAESKSPYVIRQVAGNPNTPRELRFGMALSNVHYCGMTAFETLASDLTESELEKLSCATSATVLHAVVRHPKTSKETLISLVLGAPQAVSLQAYRRLSPHLTSSEVLDLAEKILGYPPAYADVIIANIIEERRLSQDQLKQLFHKIIDRSDKYFIYHKRSFGALFTILAPSFTPDEFMALANGKNQEIRETIAAYPGTPREVLISLLLSESISSKALRALFNRMQGNLAPHELAQFFPKAEAHLKKEVARTPAVPWEKAAEYLGGIEEDEYQVEVGWSAGSAPEYYDYDGHPVGGEAAGPIFETRRGYVELTLSLVNDILRAHSANREKILGLLEKTNPKLFAALKANKA